MALPLSGPFGLNCNILFDSIDQLTIVPGRQSLYRAAAGPEGVLLRRITSMADAFKAGGLLLMSTQVPGRWWFAIGDSLSEAITNGDLGKSAGYTRRGDTNYFRHESLPGLFNAVHQAFDGQTLVLTSTFETGRWTAIPLMLDYFQQADTVLAFGLVTSADEGYGQSHPVGDQWGAMNGALNNWMSPNQGLSFASSLIPMTVPFSTFMAGVKAAALALIPSDVRQYYDAAYGPAMQAFAKKDEKPTLGVSTFWRGVNLSPGFHTTPQDDTFNPQSFWAYTMTVGRTEQSFMTQTVLGSNYNRVVDTPGAYQVCCRPGFFDTNATTRPVMHTFSQQFGTYHDITPLTGKIEGLDVGLIRDGHVLARSLVDGQRFATDPPSHTTLGRAIAEYVDPFHNSGLSPNTVAANAGEGEATASFMKSRTNSKNVFLRGTLADMLEAFSAAWDNVAYTTAKG